MYQPIVYYFYCVVYCAVPIYTYALFTLIHIVFDTIILESLKHCAGFPFNKLMLIQENTKQLKKLTDT